jgi:hypothetical protein
MLRACLRAEPTPLPSILTGDEKNFSLRFEGGVTYSIMPLPLDELALLLS